MLLPSFTRSIALVLAVGVAAPVLAAVQPQKARGQSQAEVEPADDAMPRAQSTQEAGAVEEPAREPGISFDFGGRVQMDYTMFTDSEPFDGAFGGVENDGEFRRLRARASGHVGRFNYKAQLDFAGQEVNPKDLYVGLRGLPVKLRAGYQYEPWSLEQQTSSRYVTFMERSFAIAFSPDRNLGLRVIKDHDKAYWSVGVFRETSGWETRPGEHYNITSRAAYAPILSNDQRRLLHLGVSHTHKFVDGALSLTLRPDAHIAPPVVRLTVPASSADYVQLEASTNLGSLGVQSEYARGWIQSVERSDPSVWAAYAQASFFLTGEHRPYSSAVFGRVKPRRSLYDGGPGAIEIKARYSYADFSEATENGVSKASSFTTGVNWYWTSHLRTMAEFSRTSLPDAGVESTSIWKFRFMTDW